MTDAEFEDEARHVIDEMVQVIQEVAGPEPRMSHTGELVDLQMLQMVPVGRNLRQLFLREPLEGEADPEALVERLGPCFDRLEELHRRRGPSRPAPSARGALS